MKRVRNVSMLFLVLIALIVSAVGVSPVYAAKPDWSTLGTTPLNGAVTCIAVSGTDVYVGGQFTNAGGDPNADYIAKWNGSTWSALGTTPLTGGTWVEVISIAVSGTDVYVGGSFTNAGGDPNADNIAKWNGSAWSALGTTPFSGEVTAIAVSGTDLYAGGGNGSGGIIMAKWNGSGWSMLGTTPINGPLFAIAVSGTDVYIGGLFDDVGGDPHADNIAKWNGSAWSALGTANWSAYVTSVAVSGTDVYVGGGFHDLGGDPNADHIAKWDGSTWSALGTTPLDDSVYALAVNGTDVYVGGGFSNAGGNPNADRFAKWNGSDWSAMGTTPLTMAVSSIAISGTDLYVGRWVADAGGDYISKLDINMPKLTSIVREAGALNPTSETSVNFTVTFDRPVTGVDADDFKLTTALTGTSIATVSGADNVYTVTVNTGIGNGAIRLDARDTATIQDLDGYDFIGPYTGGETYTVVKEVAPTVQSITVAGPNPIDGAYVDFTVTFDKPVTGVDKDDFSLTQTGSIVDPSIVTVTEVSQSVYTVTVNSGIGNGTIRLDLRATATIEDLSAHAFVGPYTGGETYTLTIDPLIQQAYLKASNTGAGDWFGYSVAISGDTLVVGAHYEDGNATGVNGNQSDDSASDSGAAYVFTRSGDTWSQQAYLKASNTGANDWFGYSVAISGDTLVVGALGESSNATGVNGTQSNNSAYYSGAAYVFTRSGTTWSQQAYLKASNTGAYDSFGGSVSISGDTIVVGAHDEDSNATGVNGNQSDNSAPESGAAYVFTRSDGDWSQQAYLKASNTGANDYFGGSVSISGDTIVVGAPFEASNATGVNGNQSDDSASDSGAAYVFTRSGDTWSQQAYLKASNTGTGDLFGLRVAISGDTLVVGSHHESSNATGVNGDQSDDSASDSGAAYVFTRSGDIWSQQAYLKASNTGVGDRFGSSVAISGNRLVVGASGESSNATGVNGDGSDNSALESGAAYVFARSGDIWSQQAYLKASNTGAEDWFGSVAILGETIVVGASGESSNATGMNGDGSDNSAFRSGAVYEFLWPESAPIVQSITLAGLNPIDGAGLDFTVTFDKPVTSVDKADFSLTKTGSIMGASVTKVVAVSQSVYTVTVNSGIGNGSLRLDLPATATIQDLSGAAFVGPYTGDETYTVNKGTAPTVPVLKLPKNKSLVTTNTPTLDWGDSSQVMALATGWHYEIQITAPYGAYNETFNTQASADPVVGLGASSFTIPAEKSLPANTTFTWRVRAFDAAYRYSAWSKEFTFRTGTPVITPTVGAPTVPALKLPKNKSLVAGYTLVLLDWNDSALPATATAGCLYYEVRVTSPYRNYNASFTTAASEYTIPAENILPADSTFTWQVRSACNDGATTKYSVWSKEFIFRTKLATPTLLSPIDDALTPLDNIRPTFTWEPVSGAAGYTLQVSKDGKVVVTGTVKAPAYSFTPKKDLLASQLYTWKVKANGKNPGDYSAPFTFVTGASAPAIPTPSAPKNNALVENAAEQTLVWSVVDNATPAVSYEVEYASNAAFMESIIVPAAEKQLVLPGGTLLPGRTYYWRVRSLSAAGNHSAWSKALAIKVKFVAPTLTSPANGDTNVLVRPTFTWSSANGLWTFYTLQIAPDNAFGKGTRTIKVNAPTTKYTILDSQPALSTGIQYCWRVKINGLYFPVQPTTVNCFTTAAP